jgi:CRISPR-associated endonuclease/helicase Cas3
MNTLNFDAAFAALTDNPPFPWQSALYQRFITGDFPPSCNLPTGLGKTSVIHIWLLALAHAPNNVPRRLVYVVNRRTVVDQSTREAEKIRDRLNDLTEVTAALHGLCAADTEVPLAISTLRGQFADNEEWSFDPARPAVVVGTVDMIGSRLLFSGYGIGRYDRTHQVGLLGCDTLLVHDEAHLTDPFQQLLNAIIREQGSERAAGRGLRVLELTATTRHHEGRPPPFGLGSEDESHSVVKQRLDAAKAITLHPAKDVTGEIVKLAAGHKESGRAILVFVQTPDQVNEVKEKLSGREHKVPAENIVTLTGTMRGYERDRLAAGNSPVFARFLPDARPDSQTVYLVCTSAGEVGIDISADDLACDLSTYESMAQRLGRVNRRGGIDPRTGQPRHARIDVVHEPEIDTDTPRGERRELTRILLQRLVDEHAGSVSPRTLGSLPDKDKSNAFGPPVPTLDTTDILLDAWALTTISDDLPGRPPVAQWLHGVEPPDQPTTSFAWREDVTLLAPKAEADDAAIQARAEAIKEYLDEYPLKHHEKLAERTARLVSVPNADPDETGRRQHLKEFAKRAADLPAWLIDIKGRVTLSTVGKLAELDFGELIGRTVVLPPAAGGLSSAGMLSGRESYDSGREYDVADHTPGGGPITRCRAVVSPNDDADLIERPVAGELPDEDARESAGFQMVAEIVLVETEEGDPSRRFVAWVAAAAIEGEQSRSRRARFQQYLDEHLKQAEKYATALAKRLLPIGPEQVAVRLAAKWHDLGKDRGVWQRGVGNSDLKRPWAKSGRGGRIHGLNSYRHEFGSLLDLADAKQAFRVELEAQPAEVRELVRHLIAAHHARGRPHFPPEEAIDLQHPQAEWIKLAQEVPRRFAQLQRKYGRWGLAYLESLVRAADILASQKAEGGTRE